MSVLEDHIFFAFLDNINLTNLDFKIIFGINLDWINYFFCIFYNRGLIIYELC